MASTTAADARIETLLDWGIDTVFGIPGDGINGIIEALCKRSEDIRFVQVRHEEAAAFMRPMPPKVSVRQPARFTRSLASGTPNAGRIAPTVASDTLRELV